MGRTIPEPVLANLQGIFKHDLENYMIVMDMMKETFHKKVDRNIWEHEYFEAMLDKFKADQIMRKIEGMIGCRREDAPNFKNTTIEFKGGK